MIRRIIGLAAAAFMAAAPLCFADTDIYGIDIDVELRRDGSALVTETWDVRVSGITEWYLVRGNLGDICISDLQVSENGQQFINEGEWDIDRNIRQKAFRCGIVEKSNGCEICWGVGSDGPHVFTVSYSMSNAVKSLEDYDMLHLQLVSPGLSSEPERVRVSISAPVQLDTTVARIWGFGYYGTTGFENGKAVFDAPDGLEYEGSVIALLRFDKGIFESDSEQDRPFEEALDEALEGSSYFEEDVSFWEVLAGLVSWLFGLFIVIAGIAAGASSSGKPSGWQIKRFLGKKPKDIGWCRSIPFDADLLECNYVAQNAGLNEGKKTLSAALILKMLQDGYLLTQKDNKGKIEFLFNDSADTSKLSPSAQRLLEMMREASGSDNILQDKEFSRWAKKNPLKVSKWTKEALKIGQSGLAAGGYFYGKSLTAKGKEKACELVGFKKYLEDFTLLGERHTEEVVLWKEYLCLAALFGIAEKVAKELKDINPEAFEEVIGYDYATMNTILFNTRRLSEAITNSIAAQEASRSGSSGGFGGASSFGGGGGFSGGGFGGGGR
jgi:hypothetical protein